MESIKGLIDYLLSVIKFWVVVQPWERGIRVRFGKKQKLLIGGVHFRVPFLDTVYIQCIRLRVIALPMQSLTSKDMKTVTLNGCIGYEITDIEKLYNTMLYPEQTISNIVMGAIADYIYTNDILTTSPSKIEESAMKKLDLDKHWLSVKYFKLTSFAVVRTYRLIQDHSWIQEGIKLDNKK